MPRPTTWRCPAPDALRRLTDAAAVAANAAQQLRAQAEAARAQVPRAAARMKP